MTQIQKTSTSISRLAFSLLLLFAATVAQAQGKLFSLQKDSVPLFRGFAVSVDIAGPLVKAMSDYGEMEGSLRINLHDQYFPIVEIGYGEADHNNEVTQISYSTKAPYFRVGCDLNLVKNKHTPNRIYGGKPPASRHHIQLLRLRAVLRKGDCSCEDRRGNTAQRACGDRGER